MKRLLAVAWVVGAGWLLLWLAPGSRAQLIKPESVVEVRLEPARVELKRGRTASVTLLATVKEGFHVNSDKPAQDYLIPTRVELLSAAPVEIEKVDYPPGELKSFGFAPDEKLSVYEGTVKVPLRLRAKPEAPAGLHAVRLAFHYQACNDQLCLRPARREVELKLFLQ